MQIKITCISRIFLCFISIITFSTVNAWISVGLSYGICESTFTSDVIHINEKDAQFYTNSTNVKQITSHDQTSDGFSLTVTMYGCTSDCGWEFDLTVSSSKKTVIPVKNPFTYTCPGYTWQVNLETNVLKIGDTPHPHYPFSFPLAMYYCGKSYNIDNNTVITPQPPDTLGSNIECTKYYSIEPYDINGYFDYQNDELQFPYNKQKPAALSIVATTDNAFTYYRNHYLAIKYTLNNVSTTLIDHLSDFAPFYSNVPDKSIQYDFVGMQSVFQEKFCNNNLLSIGSIFVDSVPRDYPVYLDQNGAPIGRTVFTTDFYFPPPCFWCIGDSDNKVFTFDNFDNDINDYYNAVYDMTISKPLFDNIDIFTPSSHLLTAPNYQSDGLINFGVLDIQDIITPIVNAVIASSILNNYGLIYCTWVDQSLCNTACMCECAAVGYSFTCLIHGEYDCNQLIHHNNCVFGSYNYKPDIMDKITSYVGDTIDVCQNGANGWVINAGNCEDSSTIRCSGYPDGCNSIDCSSTDKGWYFCSCDNDCKY